MPTQNQVLNDKCIVSFELTSQNFDPDNLGTFLRDSESDRDHNTKSDRRSGLRSSRMAFGDGVGSNAKLVLATTILIFLGTLFAFLAVIFSGKVNTTINTLVSDVSEIKSRVSESPSDDDPVTPAPSDELCRSNAVSEKEQVDCHPEGEGSEERCRRRGCCWNKESTSSNISCHFPLNYQGFKVSSVREAGDKKKITIRLDRYTPSGFPDEVKGIQVEVIHLTETQVRIRITDARRERFEPPIPVLNVYRNPYDFIPQYQVDVSREGLLKLTRKSSGTTLLDIDLRQVIFADQYLQLSSNLPANQIYGLGEHFEDYRIDMDQLRRFTFLNGDRPPKANKPLYGAHPFFYQVEDTSHGSANTFGVLLFNNNPKDIMLYPKPSIQYRSTGGIFDFFIYLGSDPQDVIQQHLTLIGKPDLPPFWALGWHLCKWGYNSLNQTKKIHDGNRALGIPFDVQWQDIDYMNSFEDFTYDKVNFAGLPQWVRKIQGDRMKYVPILDPAIEGGDTDKYLPFKEGKELDIFVKNDDGSDFVGKVWNTNNSYFPDFTHPKTADWWGRQLRRFHDVIPFDGIWIDMNEPANFFDGSETEGCPKDHRLENPPYVPGDGSDKWVRKTICMSTKHFIGPHADVHNMYAIYEAKMTKEALLAIKKQRQLIVSRATVTGQGQYGMHWTGDVWSDWESMRQSISSIFQSSMNGFPYVGADICGFMGNTTMELCTRWSALGAFYPFSRNHNHEDSKDQDPFSMGGSVVDATKKNNLIRYSLLPYLYTLFFDASKSALTPFRPLTFNFPTDPLSYQYVSDQFMWGDGLLFIPVLHENKTSVTGYFPPGTWYHLINRTTFVGSETKDREVTVDVPLTDIGIFVRGGAILPMQEPKLTTTEQRKTSSLKLLVALDSNGKADGKVFWDDGDSFDTINIGRYNLLKFSASDRNLTSNVVLFEYPDDATIFKSQSIEVIGVSGDVTSVRVNGVEAKKEEWSFDKNKNHLTVTKEVDLSKDVTVSW